MKKLIFLTIALFMFTIPLSINSVKASGADYLSYTELEFENPNNKLLINYSDVELEKYDSKISSKKFNGWNTYYFKKHQKVNYTAGI